MNQIDRKRFSRREAFVVSEDLFDELFCDAFGPDQARDFKGITIIQSVGLRLPTRL
ncbi:hypothetical protein DOT_0235 [Desulfosporosinus sp. OT]|nr:hypothetical protein DOT_0235 [Desulfosporosinus sp. OT]